MISQRQRRTQLLSTWAWDVLNCVGTVILLGAILAVLFIEFPDGIHVGLVAGPRTILLNH